MINRTKVEWAGEEVKFGPSVYDERSMTYNWRTWKRGATWGAMATFILTTQYAMFQQLMSPGKRAMREVMIIPFMWSAMIACGFGVFECLANP